MNVSSHCNLFVLHLETLVNTKPLSVTLPLFGLSCVLCGPDGTESLCSTGSLVDRPEGQ